MTLIDVVAEIGGAEVLAVELLRGLDPDAFRRTLVVYRRLEPGSRERESQERVVAGLRADGVRVVTLEGTSRYDVQSWRPFARLLRRGDVDVVHSHLFGPNLWAALWTRIAPRTAFVAHEHTWSYEGRPLRKLADRWVVAAASDAFLAVSEQDRRQMLEREHIPAAAIRVLPNGIAPPAAPVVDLRAQLGVPAGAPLIGSVGLLRPQKDFGTLIRAHATVVARHPEARLAILGDGEEGDALRSLVDELGLGDRVLLPGFQEGGAAAAAAFDVAVNSSTFEGSSLAIIEYMALGRPIVATSVGGTPDLLAGGAAGVLVEPRDPQAFGTAVADLLDDPARAQRLGARAQERQRAEYDVGVQVRRLEALYRELVSRRA
ncbi:glycosyltransferase [Baekduia alba]|uniref:glycosyltransferase n=1 Tax=Baekduia alba TaxID=2997333 RepID=UPI0023416270|nr:glycosyltransferase [Baekduia alba]